jgi:hypothetical protein
LDLDDQGQWQVWRADHGVIPPEVTRSGLSGRSPTGQDDRRA